MLACVTVGTLLVPAPAAHADPTYHYRGGCAFYTISDGTDSSQTSWEGEIHTDAVATYHHTDELATEAWIQVACEITVNGYGTFVHWAGGSGSAVSSAQFQFHADPDDVVTLCDHVLVENDQHYPVCREAPASPVIPAPIQEVIQNAETMFDDAACDTIGSLEGNPTDGPPLDIHDGDIYINGQRSWDCPPYDTWGESKILGGRSSRHA